MTKVVVVFAVAVIAAAVAAPAVIRNGSALGDRLPSLERKSAPSAQSAAQISDFEFAGLHSGLPASVVRARLGEPDETSSVQVERRRIECWYYGIAEGTGAYQLCFSSSRLASKRKF